VGLEQAALHAPRLGIPRSLFADKVGPEVHAHLDSVAARFAAAGARVDDVAVPESASAVFDAGQVVLRADAAAFHRRWFDRHADSYRPRIRGLIEDGRRVSAVDYVLAQRARRRFRTDMASLLQQLDALLMPVAPTTAPRGLESTGDPILCAPWSFSGLPAIALPSGLGEGGLPLGIQLAGAAFREDRLLATARWCELVLGFQATPPIVS
jgi:amidase